MDKIKRTSEESAPRWEWFEETLRMLDEQACKQYKQEDGLMLGNKRVSQSKSQLVNPINANDIVANGGKIFYYTLE